MHIARLYVYISFPFSKNTYISFQPNDEFNEILVYGTTSKGNSLCLYMRGWGLNVKD